MEPHPSPASSPGEISVVSGRVQRKIPELEASLPLPPES
jgi:hypothetical protein